METSNTEMGWPSELADGDFDFQDSDEISDPIVEAKEIDQVIDQIRAANKHAKWTANIDLQLKTKRWRPSAVTESGRAVLYVCLTGRIPRYVASRIAEAHHLGIKIYVALTLKALYTPEFLNVLAAIDADVFVLQDHRSNDLRPRHFMAAMADLGVPTKPCTRVKICQSVYAQISSGTKQEKGRRFEALLAFLLSQVSDFRVVERNLRTETQELDIVLQIDHHSQRAWQQHVPYLLVEAKNWKDRTPQKVVSGLMMKIRTKGQSCKMGLLISTGGFTVDAENEELRYSESENRIILIGPTELESLIEALDLDHTLDELVRRGRLR